MGTMRRCSKVSEHGPTRGGSREKSDNRHLGGCRAGCVCEYGASGIRGTKQTTDPGEIPRQLWTLAALCRRHGNVWRHDRLTTCNIRAWPLMAVGLDRPKEPSCDLRIETSERATRRNAPQPPHSKWHPRSRASQSAFHLSGVEQTSRFQGFTSAYDPKRTRRRITADIRRSQGGSLWV